MNRIIIRNAEVYDGGAGEAYHADIIIAEGMIEAVDRTRELGGQASVSADLVIDAGGKIAVPGFVDAHSHSDFTVMADPLGASKLWQGITTEVVGNCGGSAFPLRGDAMSQERKLRKSIGLEIAWNSADDYFSRLDKLNPAFNVASFVGHNTIRAGVMGFVNRLPDEEEMAAMARQTRQAIEAGAMGLSTGLIYSPGMYADTGEIITLARAVAEERGIYASHVRGEGDHLEQAAEEFARIIMETGCQGQYSHLKASGKRNWGKAQSVIGQIEAMNRDGFHVRFDRYPYTASSTELASLLPNWAREGSNEAVCGRLKDRVARERIIQEVLDDYAGGEPWSGILLVSAGTGRFAQYAGRNIHDIAVELSLEPIEAVLDILESSQLEAAICNFTMNQEETDSIILHPLCMICTDAEALSASGPLSGGNPHPRAFGAFPKYFREYVKERRLLSLPEAVRKATSLPCETFGFSRRGRIAAGYHADVVIIDWEKFTDRADYVQPHQYCAGIESVIVNGVLTIHEGRFTERRGGKVLRRINGSCA